MITNEYRDSLDKVVLHESISIPSKVHAYSLGVEYMRNWFVNKFEDGFFKTEYMNGKYIFDDFRRFNRTKLVKVEKPALSITPTIDHEYNREMVDLKLGGFDVLTRRSRFNQDRIIQDYDNNFFLQMTMEIVKINFLFKVRVSTRAQQIDLANRMRYAFRVGSTQKEFVSYDFHLPYEAMINMAKHNGFEITYPEKDKDEYPKIKNIAGFLQYLNSHSMYPILYKMRTVNGNNEFFMRMPNICTHISNIDPLQLDDGEREEHLDNNFHIEMNCVLSLPVPQQYFFYSSEAVEEKLKLQSKIAGLYSFRDIVPPRVDEHGWREFLSTEYIDEDNIVESIDLTELVEGSDLYKVIQYTIESCISPAVFMNVKLFNAHYEKIINISWSTLVITLKDPRMKSDVSYLSIYVDLEYMNNCLTMINESLKDRQSGDGLPNSVSICKST